MIHTNQWVCVSVSLSLSVSLCLCLSLCLSLCLCLCMQGACDAAWHSSGGFVATAGGRDVVLWDIGYLHDYELSKSRFRV
jgi:hypothetical protein